MFAMTTASGKTARGAGVVRCNDLFAGAVEKTTTVSGYLSGRKNVVWRKQ
jgi:hypothetical protein